MIDLPQTIENEYRRCIDMRKLLWKRITAFCLTLTLAFMLPAGTLAGSESQAATAGSGDTYIAEVKLFVKKQGTLKDAKNWCENQNETWRVLDGDLNAGASGAFSKDTNVFFCYRTTGNPDEAITDLAVMNEKGNYSEGEYKYLLKEQRDQYIDMVNNMKGMLTEYRKNFENKVPVAVKAHDFLNMYIDDDSDQLLGDLLIKADDDKLTDVLLQANGLVILTIQQQLASACDSAKTTWLDRMAKLGSYDGLKAAFSKNVGNGSVVKTIDNQYREKAKIILDCWDDVHKKIAHFGGYLTDIGMENATEEQFKELIENMSLDNGTYVDFEQYLALLTLADYSYDGKTLLDFFSQTKEQIQAKGLEVLYPLAASLTNGQICALEESVGLFTLVQDALGANAYNDYEKGMNKAVMKRVSDSVRTGVKDTVKSVNQMIEKVGNTQKISIYEGVDREVYGGGVAVTTEAKEYSNGAEKTWTESFYRNMKPTKLMIGMWTGAATTAIVAGAFAHAERLAAVKYRDLMSDGVDFKQGYMIMNEDLEKALEGTDHVFTKTKYSEELIPLFEGSNQRERLSAEAVEKMADDIKTTGSHWKIYTGLKWGFTVFTVLLSAADIAVTIYSFYKYYNVDHLPIPHHIVNLSYNENEEAAYTAYKSVRDQNGKCGDLNGGDCKQWLALYYTKDKKAGAPILAPGDSAKVEIKTGDNTLPGKEYTPLHMFGTSNVAQNLTFADGDNGWSYNDKNHGTYLFFKHADNEKKSED